MSTIQELINLNQSVLIKATSRHGFVAPPGYVIVSIDVASQEIALIAAASGDELMLRSLKEPKLVALLDETGNPVMSSEGIQVFYDNPYADLHTLTCKDCCFPHLYEGKPEWMWVEQIGKNKSLLTTGKEPRFYGKVTNFQINYGATANALLNMKRLTLNFTNGKKSKVI